jgi:hypothetical protein
MKNNKRYLSVLLVLISLLFLTIPASAQSPTPVPQTGDLQHGDKFILGDTFRLKYGESLDGNLVVVGGTVNIEKGAQVNGDIVLTGGTIAISGSVKGDIVAIGGAINLDDTAVVDGDVSAVGASIKRSDGAQISGQVTEQGPLQLDLNQDGQAVPVKHTPSLLEKILAIAFESLAMAALAVVLALIFPTQIKRVAQTVNSEFWVSGGVGLITMIGAPVVLVIMTITIILIPVMIFSVLALALTTIYGWVIAGYDLGERFSTLLKVNWPVSVSAGIGVLVLSLVVGLVTLIPCVGWILGFLIIVFTLGGIVISRFGSNKYAATHPQIHVPLQAPVPPATPEPPAA